MVRKIVACGPGGAGAPRLGAASRRGDGGVGHGLAGAGGPPFAVGSRVLGRDRRQAGIAHVGGARQGRRGHRPAAGDFGGECHRSPRRMCDVARAALSARRTFVSVLHRHALRRVDARRSVLGAARRRIRRVAPCLDRLGAAARSCVCGGDGGRRNTTVAGATGRAISRARGAGMVCGHGRGDGADVACCVRADVADPCTRVQQRAARGRRCRRLCRQCAVTGGRCRRGRVSRSRSAALRCQDIGGHGGARHIARAP
ncbi:hypothetical protein PAN31108_00413 [Pandoraea anhela]|uniref:Uncharacterized protein n=1 Tax=Pandoraea anhela TaxID=2508295 RepID=A0A5E4RW13_9BURK|nr:hypothetical protein PAN31108_00413 [Pandoraea anhela]